MARRLRIWNKGGLPSRTIPIAGRNAMRPNGRLAMIGSLAERNELDWPALLAALGTDDVVVELSAVESDLVEHELPAIFRCGRNVELQCGKASGLRVVSDGAFGHLERPRFTCCGLGFTSALDYGRHRRNDAAHRDQPRQEAEAEWPAATTETR